jgi:V8-like Glu-specific endopeptidase
MDRNQRFGAFAFLCVSVFSLSSGVSGCADDAPKASLPKLYDITSAPKAIRRAAKAVVRIQHPAGLSGTGSFISAHGMMLTNNHVLGTEECAREGCDITLSFDHQRGEAMTDSNDVFAVPLNADPGLDMAVVQVYEDASLKVRLATPDYLAFDAHDAKELLGEHVTAVGHPLGRLKKWSSGVVIEADGLWFESTVFSLPGSSGSPMLNDEGQIVGLLHRGAEGFDLLTRTGSNVSAIATASAQLVAAQDAELPATMISVDDELTAEQVIAHSDVFLAASVDNANVAGTQTALTSVLGDACDAGLAREDYTTLEDMMDGLGPCLAALDFIECRSDLMDEPAAVASCPPDRAAWVARLETVVQRQLDFNGALELSPISFGIQALSLSEADGDKAARKALLAALDQADPVYDFALAPYLAAFDIEDYAGQGTVDLIKNYRRFPYYERSAWDITLASLWLNSTHQLSRDQAVGIAKALYHNAKIDLGARLRIEEVLYNSGEL